MVSRGVAAVTALALSLSPLLAWAPATRAGMVDEAIRFMPRSLRSALETDRRAVMRGALLPLKDEDGPDHRPSWNSGTLEARIAREAAALVEALGRQTPFEELAERFGSLAHFVADAGFPPGVSRSDGARRYAHFSAFCESRRPKIPLVFYGHTEPHLQRRAWGDFASALVQRSSAEDDELQRAYRQAGDPPQAAYFDDRSVPFAVASLAYSRSVTDLVRVWLTAWAEAGGDLGYTPYLRLETLFPEESAPHE